MYYGIIFVTLHYKTNIDYKSVSKVFIMFGNNKGNMKNFEKMTLSGYYHSLPNESPRSSFLKKIAREAGVTETAVVGWCKDGRKPHKYEHVVILSKATGIKPEDLWR